MIFDNRKQIAVEIGRYSYKTTVKHCTVIAIIYFLLLASCDANLIFGKAPAVYLLLDLIIIVPAALLIWLKIWSNRSMGNVYLYSRCDPMAYAAISRRKDSKRNHAHNLYVDTLTSFYTGKLEDSINFAKLLISLPKAKQLMLLQTYHYLGYALFLSGRFDECNNAMDEAKKLQESGKPYPFENDFLFMRKYLGGDYESALRCYDTKPARTSDIRDVRVCYFLSLAYCQIGDIGSQKKCMEEIAGLDNKTFFGAAARDFLGNDYEKIIRKTAVKNARSVLIKVLFTALSVALIIIPFGLLYKLQSSDYYIKNSEEPSIQFSSSELDISTFGGNIDFYYSIDDGDTITGYEIFYIDPADMFGRGWTVISIPYSYTNPVAIDITPTNVISNEYKGYKAHYKDFEVDIYGTKYPFRVFYVELPFSPSPS